MDETTILFATKEISELLNRQLDDYAAQTITLTRDQALITLGIVGAAIEQMEREQSK